MDRKRFKAEREIQRRLRERAREEKEIGNKVKIRYMKLCTEDRVLRWNEKRKELEERKKEGMKESLEGGRRERRRAEDFFWNVVGLRHLCEDTWEYKYSHDLTLWE